MILQYTDISAGKLRKTKAKILACAPPAASPDMPTIVLPGGETLDFASWVALGYRVVSLPEKEKLLMGLWYENLHRWEWGLPAVSEKR